MKGPGALSRSHVDLKGTGGIGSRCAVDGGVSGRHQLEVNVGVRDGSAVALGQLEGRHGSLLKATIGDTEAIGR